MDRDRFDALARLLATSGSRRVTLGALLSALVGPTAAKAGRKRRRDRGKDEAEDREREQRLQAERRGKGGKRRKSKKKRRGGSDGGQTPSPSPDCCGTESCADPEPGSTHAGCDHAGRSFIGQDHNGSTFRGIDGRKANFNQTDNHGSVFAEACLQGASFRRAKLGGSTWGDACLFGADFTGADLGNESAVFAGALFCGTTLPDGSVNDRDCGRETACCRAQPTPTCQTAADCADQGCRTKACTNGQCVYAAVADGPDPNDECGANASGHCCEGVCCLGNATECNPSGLCCAPNCAGRECGPDGCGSGGTCGPACPPNAVCNANGQCRPTTPCTAQSCPDGCCDGNGVCRSGSTDQNCGRGGVPCVRCQAGQFCCSTPSCGQFLGACVCGEESCPDGCCENATICRPGTTNAACGTDGDPCNTCDPGRGQVCDATQRECICTPQTCPDGCCDGGPGNPGVCQANRPPLCGINGALCQDCVGNGQCNAQGQCVCTADCTGKVCGGDGCGGSCGTCRPGETCNQARGQCTCTATSCPAGTVCNAQGRCVCTPTSCPGGQRCVNDRCLCDGQSCPSGCCDDGPGNPGVCQAGTSNAFCGAGGGQCVACPAGTACNGQRQCVCTPGSCPIGQTCRHGGCFLACDAETTCAGCGGAGCRCDTEEDFCVDSTAFVGVCGNDDDCPLGTLCSFFENNDGQRLCTRPCPGCAICTPGSCPSGQTCVHGGCFLACDADATCQTCGGGGCPCGNEEGFCLDSTIGFGVCGNDDDCPQGTLCSFFLNGAGQRLCVRPCPGCATT